MIIYLEHNAFNVHRYEGRVKIAKRALWSLRIVRVILIASLIFALMVFANGATGLSKIWETFGLFATGAVFLFGFLQSFSPGDLIGQQMERDKHSLRAAKGFGQTLEVLTIDDRSWTGDMFGKLDQWLRANCTKNVWVVTEENLMFGYRAAGVSFECEEDRLLFRLTFK